MLKLEQGSMQVKMTPHSQLMGGWGGGGVHTITLLHVGPLRNGNNAVKGFRKSTEFTQKVGHIWGGGGASSVKQCIHKLQRTERSTV